MFCSIAETCAPVVLSREFLERLQGKSSGAKLMLHTHFMMLLIHQVEFF